MNNNVVNSAKNISTMNLVAILAVPLIWFFEAAALGPALAVILEAFPGTSKLISQLVMTAPFLTTTLFSLVAGRLAKTYNKRNIIIFGLLIYGVTGMAPAFATSINTILILRVLTGIGAGLCLPLPSAIISEHFTGEKREKLTGMTTSVANIANLSISAIVGFLLAFGWQWSFYSFAVIFVVLIIAIFFLPSSPPIKETEQVAKENVEVSPKSKSVPPVVYALGLFMLFGWVFTGFTTLNIAFRFVELKYSTGMIGIGLVFPGLGAMFAGFVFSQLSRSLKSFYVPVAIFITAAGYFGMSTIESFIPLLGAILLVGFGTGSIVSFILNMTALKTSLEQRDASYGIVNSCMHLGLLVMPFIQLAVGMVFNNNSLIFLYHVSSIFLVIAGVIFIIARKKVSSESIELGLDSQG
ncbi:MFS transporter [Clostridium sp. PL3]|uniref:MFS transporter n=1 Tax=Clostridium thailandense TaxID=2794346 RepID=A0A949U397_9CLOT|nr:MFS transporter [Clostridium thailandense]MBV7275653.1 MFS transporter [Clostridium thailandense]